MSDFDGRSTNALPSSETQPKNVYALFDTLEIFDSSEIADDAGCVTHLYMYLGLRTSKVALPKCLQEIKKWRTQANSAMDIVGLSEDHGDHIVTLEIDFGPASQIIHYSEASVSGWHAINAITANMHRYQPRLTGAPLKEEMTRVGAILAESPYDEERSNLDRVITTLLSKQAVAPSRAGLTPVPARTAPRA